MTGAAARAARLRVLIVAEHFAEIVLRFGQALSAHCDVRVVVDAANLSNECGTTAGLIAPDVRVRAVPTRRGIRGWHRIAWTYAVARELLLFRPDIVQFEETVSRTLRGLFRRARRAAPVVLRVHDVETHKGSDSRMPAAMRDDRNWMRANADLVMVHGRFCYDAFTARHATPTIETVHGIILPPDAYREPVPGSILMFGRMEAYKGLDTLIAALEILSAHGVGPVVTIAGRGPEIARLRPRLDALANVRVLDGFVPFDRLAELFQDAEIVVVPYKGATQSGVAAAGFANHRIVVASDVGRLPDVVTHENNGLLVPPDDPVALAAALRRLQEDRALALDLRRGAAQSAGRLAWPAIVQPLAGLFAELVAQKDQKGRS